MKTRSILYADEGFVLTDGKAFGKIVYLAEGESADAWREIPESEIPSGTLRLMVASHCERYALSLPSASFFFTEGVSGFSSSPS